MTTWQIILVHGSIGGLLGWCFGEAQSGTGPFIRLGAWLDARARCKSLRLLNSIAHFAWDQAEELT